MDIAELENIHNKIISDEIDLEEAKELIYSTKHIKSWHTKEWKELRKAMLKKECEQCGSKEALTIQHTCHPERYGDIKYRVSQKYGELLNKEYELSDLANYDEAIEYFNKNYIQQECLCCPKCESYNLMTRKTKSPKYRCNRCKYDFEEGKTMLIPRVIDDRSSNIKINEPSQIGISKLLIKVYREKIIEIKNKLYSKQIEKETLLIVLDQLIRYQSFEGTITYCRKCAFMIDKNHMDLCPKCKKEYKYKVYPSCKKCNNLI